MARFVCARAMRLHLVGRKGGVAIRRPARTYLSGVSTDTGPISLLAALLIKANMGLVDLIDNQVSGGHMLRSLAEPPSEPAA